ncbi:MAG: heavy-metal-associated domain-containing protein [Planctomycetota bacterium]
MLRIIPTAFLLSALLLTPANAEDKHGSDKEASELTSLVNKTPEKGLKMAKTETVLFVDDLHCKTCAKKISGKLYAVKSVAKVRTHVKKDYAIVTPQKSKQLDIEKLWKASQDAGFQPLRLVGPAGVYVPDTETKAPVKAEPAKQAA